LDPSTEESREERKFRNVKRKEGEGEREIEQKRWVQ
jgi:hypothetical protein